MRPVVAEQFVAFTAPLEGGIPFLYADIRNLITIGYGYLVDPLSVALTLPLEHHDGTKATQAEITADWLRVKGDPRCAKLGHGYARTITSLWLPNDAMADLALAKLHANDAVLRGRVDGWEELPACAQLALHSLAWACGPMFNFPKLLSAVQARDFGVAAVHIQMNETTPEGTFNAGLRARNERDRILMLNAQRVDSYKLDPELLEWHALIGVADAETVTDLSIHDEPTNPGTMYAPAILHPQLDFPDHDPDDAA